jgi:hypothetical protein
MFGFYNICGNEIEAIVAEEEEKECEREQNEHEQENNEDTNGDQNNRRLLRNMHQRVAFQNHHLQKQRLSKHGVKVTKKVVVKS